MTKPVRTISRAIFAALLVALVIAACTSSDTTSGDQRPLRGPPLTPLAQAWVTNMRTALPPMLCNHGFFSECFECTQERCRDAAVRLFDECANEHRSEIPAQPDPVSGKQAGRVIGRCVGRRLELQLKEQRFFRNNKRCNNPDNWL